MKRKRKMTILLAEEEQKSNQSDRKGLNFSVLVQEYVLSDEILKKFPALENWNLQRKNYHLDAGVRL